MVLINMTIDGVPCQVEEGKTILEAASENGICIPTLCHYDGIPGRANCRMCIVEVEKMRTFQPSCMTKVREGMVVKTNTERVRAARKTTLELILAHHAVDCHHCLRIGSSTEQNLDPHFCEMCFFCDCVRDGFCELQALAREYHVDVLPFIQHEAEYTEDMSLNSIIRNPNKCIKCRRCVDVCGDVQTVHNLSMAKRGRDIMVVPEMGKPMAESACVRCGHCVDVCPVGAIYMKEHKDEVLYTAHSYDTATAVQVSPDVVPILTKLYKVGEGDITMEKVCAALHKLGFDQVYTDEWAYAESAKEAADVIENSTKEEPLVITDSHAVVNFVDRYFLDLKESIHVYDDAQTIFSKIIAGKEHELPVRTVIVSDKKELGAEAEETGNADFVLNARELYRLFLRTGGAPQMKKPASFDSLGKAELPYPELLGPKEWNLLADPEEVDIEIQGKQYHCAVAHNLGQVRKLLEGDMQKYDIVRLLA